MLLLIQLILMLLMPMLLMLMLLMVLPTLMLLQLMLLRLVLLMRSNAATNIYANTNARAVAVNVIAATAIANSAYGGNEVASTSCQS